MSCLFLIDILVNARSLTAGITGVQRYTDELCKRLDGRIEMVSPGRPMHGPMGHLWEQLLLPSLAAGRVLWSPANAGPVSLARQVVTFHDIAVLDHPEWFGKRFAAWYRWLVPRLARRVKRIVAVSEVTRSRLVDSLGVDACSRCVHHIPPSVWLVISGVRGASQVFRNTPAMSLPRRVHFTGYVPER